MSNDVLSDILTLNCNIIKPQTVSELLDGRYFFIPSYQRGYRWSKKQIYDLCNDLLEFVLKPNKSEGSFYSLQPLIVHKGKFDIDGALRDAYEVIDGQQRLTTIFILYRFLAKIISNGDSTYIKRNFPHRELYHIYYQTRPEDFQTLEKSGYKELSNDDIKDIDIAHIANAFSYLYSWLYNNPQDDDKCAEATFSLFADEEYAPGTVTSSLFKLLDNRGTNGSVQFIWYELSTGKDPIKEFLNENKGKIPLTDTEKIKALFMQRSNFGTEVKDLKQLSIAKDWELIENTFHRNDFWAFISNDFQIEDGRINIIFKFIYDKEHSEDTYSTDADYLFRYYYQKFATYKKTWKPGKVVNFIDDMWNEVMDCFRMLLNWYYNPKVYNLIGLLVKHGYSIKQIYDIYSKTSVVTNDDFVFELNREIREVIIDKIPIAKEQADLGIGVDEEYIKLFFNVSADKAKMHDLLLFLNVREINKTIDKALADIDKEPDEKKKSDLDRSPRDVLSHIYRFPFEALDVFGWDIEHVDSATTNSLTNPEEQEDWIKEAKSLWGDSLTENPNYMALETAFQDPANLNRNETLNNMVQLVRHIIGEDESDVRKNWIGNLTLLDKGTNRSYKNKIFAWKCNIIRDRVKAGVFVPVCTQNVFNKYFNGCSNNRLQWSIEDKKAYHSYILAEIKSFKQEFTDKVNSKETTTQKLVTRWEPAAYIH